MSIQHDCFSCFSFCHFPLIPFPGCLSTSQKVRRTENSISYLLFSPLLRKFRPELILERRKNFLLPWEPQQSFVRSPLRPHPGLRQRPGTAHSALLGTAVQSVPPRSAGSVALGSGFPWQQLDLVLLFELFIWPRGHSCTDNLRINDATGKGGPRMRTSP